MHLKLLSDKIFRSVYAITPIGRIFFVLSFILLTINLPSGFSQDLSWFKNIGSVAVAEDLDAHSMCFDASGNIYIGGSFSNSVDFNGESTDNEINSGAAQTMYIAKYNTSGTRQWLIKMDAATSTNTSPLDMVAGATDLYVTGSFHNSVDFDPGAGTTTLTSAGSADIFVAKYSLATGALVWAYSTGGTNDDIGLGIAIDASENVIVAGSYQGYSSAPILVPDFKIKEAATLYPALPDNSGISDMFIASYTANCDFNWLVAGGAGSGSDEAYDVVVDASDNVYVTGSTSRRGTPTSMDFDPGAGTTNLFATMVAATASNTGGNGFLAKYTSAGALSFVKNIGQPSLGSFNCKPQGMDIDEVTSDIYITGYFEAGGTVDFDPVGTRAFTSAGGPDIFVAKYDNAGLYTIAYQMGSTGFDIGRRVDVASGGLVLTGFISETVDMNPEGTGGAQNKGAASNRSVYLGEYSKSFVYSWCHGMGNTDFDNAGVVAMINETETSPRPVYAYGYFASTVDFDPDNAGGDQTGDATEDTYFAKYTSTILPVELIKFEAVLNNVITISWTTAAEINNDYFILEKSTNGIDFYPIAKIDGAGNTTNLTSYNWPDKQVMQQQYYRLKQIDFDGSIHFSDIIYLNTRKKSNCLVVQQAQFEEYSKTIKLNLHYCHESDSHLTAQLINSAGSVILHQEFYLPDVPELKINLPSSYVPGMYMLRISINGSTEFIKLILN